jgi:hypothetical protein
LFGIVHTACNDGALRVAVLVVDDDFLPNARDGNGSNVGSRPRGGYAYPARVAAIPLTVAVPVKMHFDAAIFVVVYLQAGGADDYGGVRAVRAGHSVFV